MIQLRVVTPYGNGFQGEVKRVIARGVEGDLAFMKGTAPLVTPLAIGKMTVIFADGKKRVGNISSGYVSMKNDVLTLVSDAFEWEDEVDFARAEEAKARAEKQLRERSEQSKIEIERAELALARAINRLNRKDEKML